MSKQEPRWYDTLKSWHLLLAIAFAGLTSGLGFIAVQNNFAAIISFYIPFFLLYAFLISRPLQPGQVYFFIGLSLLLRILLLFSFPNLSDDIYRFIWDGRLMLNGINPFEALPGYYMEAANQQPGLTPALFVALNSPAYFTIYPPVCQAVFAAACYIAPESIYWSTFFMKLPMLVFEIGTILLIIKLLKIFSLPPKNVLIYALNPLIIIEITGNLHFEGPMIFFLLLAIWWLVKARYDLSAVAVGFSVASKLLPLIFLPFLIRRLGWQQSLRYFLVTGLVLFFLFLPLFNTAFFVNFGQSLDLYFRKFEFNASIYYLLRWLLFHLTGYNQIAILGPALGLIVLGGITWKARQIPSPGWQNFPLQLLFAISLYLFCATTVHPWYVSLPLVLCVFTNFRFPLIWSGLIMLTYINYSYNVYYENLWLVGLEYAVVLAFLGYEWKNITVN